MTFINFLLFYHIAFRVTADCIVSHLNRKAVIGKQYGSGLFPFACVPDNIILNNHPLCFAVD
jgi:hypothetical protein